MIDDDMAARAEHEALTPPEPTPRPITEGQWRCGLPAGLRLAPDSAEGWYGPWLSVKDGDDRAIGLFRRHYSARRYQLRRQHLFVGPGEKMVLLTPQCDALFVWRKFRSMDDQEGVNCAVFRNESALLSSELIRAADVMAYLRWPHERHYTYVNPRRIRSSNPGYCFQMAGWRRCGTTRKGLVVLELIKRGAEIRASEELMEGVQA